ncbi:MAG: hypothetical protein LBB65_05135, partial [Burkholderiales bacterium]|nr:hypothetical protein [Burkholderiales bacterium]
MSCSYKVAKVKTRSTAASGFAHGFFGLLVARLRRTGAILMARLGVGRPGVGIAALTLCFFAGTSVCAEPLQQTANSRLMADAFNSVPANAKLTINFKLKIPNGGKKGGIYLVDDKSAGATQNDDMPTLFFDKTFSDGDYSQ